jgi:hypothetical protein
MKASQKGVLAVGIQGGGSVAYTFIHSYAFFRI